MFDEKFLYDSLGDKMRELRLNYSNIPQFVSDNLKYDLFAWQKKAIENFLDYQTIKEIENPNAPTHLLFNLATGTGKTLLMAALILCYYEKGYRSFLFFVNQNNIVGKTEDNLTDPYHSKYLYANPVVINDKTISIKKVENFSEETDDIEIKFTSIHKLHNAVYQVKENDIFLEDLQNRKLVMLADEAHHLNSDTKAVKPGVGELDFNFALKPGASAKDVEKSWEHTVNNLLLNKGFKYSGVNDNVLLEFTATLPTHANVIEKYRDKVISRFDLKDFLNAGYTKEINLVSSSFNKKQRIVQALLFNWYRYRMGIEFNIPHFKPVMLFRSKYADEKLEGNVIQDYELFRDIVDNLEVKDFDFLKTIQKEKTDKVYEVGQSRIVDIVNYLEESVKSDFSSVIDYIQDSFKDSNCIITTSNDKTAKGLDGKEKTTIDQDKALNSLEDKSNPFTAVFTCQRLTEGWDVLNLYDIVRMYEGRDEGKTSTGARKAGTSTVSEVQLIGRGVRYCPFKYEDAIPNKRKFDRALDHPLRVLEEFYFHSDKDERYINELKNELKRQELLPEKDKVLKSLDIKEEIKNDKDSFYNTLLIFGNDKNANPLRRKTTLKELKEVFTMDAYIVPILNINEQQLNFDKKEDDVRMFKGSEDSRTVNKKISEIHEKYRHILYKSYNVQAKKYNSLFKFKNLKEELKINSIDDLWNDNFLGNFSIPIVLPKTYPSFASVPVEYKIEVFNKFFDTFESAFQNVINPHIGSDFKSYSFRTYFDKPKLISVVEDDKNKEIENKLLAKDWYALDGFYGTSEEINLVEFLEQTIENFKSKYDNVYLLRNEEVYKIYDFEKGRGFMPDFLLFMKSKDENLYYQIFIEPKGSDRITNDNSKWKDKFLGEITDKYGNEVVLSEENNDYKLIGLPLYNATVVKDFKQVINQRFELAI